jgi:hypothetical protein
MAARPSAVRASLNEPVTTAATAGEQLSPSGVHTGKIDAFADRSDAMTTAASTQLICRDPRGTADSRAFGSPA